ncbi:MAG: DNA-3-methyladenine glycosylase I [Pseudomonadales bacterium]|nr:DNA-3-methyladenine glycosylase I [Pseudomonadales bacterium]
MADIHRCPWLDLSKPDYVSYHDLEWGVPVYDDQKMFEFLMLESAQAGLNWYTVLKKRENYRVAFDNFNPVKIAEYDEIKIESLLNNSGIIRNRLKIEASINNARCYLNMVEKEGSFADYLWQFVDGTPIVNHFHRMSDYPTTSLESAQMSNALKQFGFKFVGSTICYAHMQATGMFNDHTVACFRRDEIISSY